MTVAKSGRPVGGFSFNHPHPLFFCGQLWAEYRNQAGSSLTNITEVNSILVAGHWGWSFFGLCVGRLHPPLDVPSLLHP